MGVAKDLDLIYYTHISGSTLTHTTIYNTVSTDMFTISGCGDGFRIEQALTSSFSDNALELLKETLKFQLFLFH